VNKKTADSMERLSSGLRINNASDDAAGMAISNKMDAQIKGLEQANRNTMDGISMIQTAEGALNEVHAILQRARELTVQAANGTNSGDDVEQIQLEINQLVSEINRIGEQTEFNTKPLLNGKELGDSSLITGPLGEVVELVGGSDTTAAEATVTFGTMNADAIRALVGTGITIDGVVVEFFDSADGAYKGSGTGIDINGLANTEDFANELVAELDGKLPNVEITTNASVPPAIDGFTLTAKEMGIEGNYIAIKDGGSVNTTTMLQVGANKGQTMDVQLGDMRADTLGLTGVPGQLGFSDENNVSDGKTNDYKSAAISVIGEENANHTLVVMDRAINKVSTQRAAFGASQNRLEHTVNNLGVSAENLTASLSRIQDADIAAEMAVFTQQNVLSQAATAMLAQANQRPQQVLQLLQR
ncbi:MAG: flagellin, partial [Cellulosilyticaceae bacterium]